MEKLDLDLFKKDELSEDTQLFTKGGKRLTSYKVYFSYDVFWTDESSDYDYNAVREDIRQP